MAGEVCGTHFDEFLAARGDAEARAKADEAVKNCIACKYAKQAALDWVQLNETIDSSQPYGQHIGLVCKHDGCGLRFHTKNIRGIGARSIFPVAGSCDHPMSDLAVAGEVK